MDEGLEGTNVRVQSCQDVGLGCSLMSCVIMGEKVTEASVLTLLCGL